MTKDRRRRSCRPQGTRKAFRKTARNAAKAFRGTGRDRMKWQGRAGSSNIEDRRGMGMALPVGGGIGGLVLLLLFSALTGTNPIDMINTSDPGGSAVGTSGVSADDP